MGQRLAFGRTITGRPVQRPYDNCRDGWLATAGVVLIERTALNDNTPGAAQTSSPTTCSNSPEADGDADVPHRTPNQTSH